LDNREGVERRAGERRERVPGPPGPPVGGERRARMVGWRSRDILRAALLIAAVYLLFRLLWVAYSLLFVAFLGILFGLALSAGVDWLKAKGLPRGVGAVLIVLAFMGVLTGMGFLLAPTLRAQTEQMSEDLPAAIDRLERWLQGQQGGVVGVILGAEEDAAATRADTVPAGADERGDTLPAGAAAAQPAGAAQQADAPGTVPRPPAQAEEEEGAGIATMRDRVLGDLGNLTRYLFPFLSSTATALGGILMIVFIAIYIAVDPSLYHRGLMHLFPHRSRKRAGEVMTNVAAMLRRWLVTQLVAMVAVGAITTLALLALRVPAAIALGVLAGLLEFIPIFGPILASIPAIAMAFIASPQQALAVAAVYVVIQQVESQLITPILMKEGMDLPPVLTIMTQATMALVFGFIGLVVAVPLLGAVLVPIKMLYVEGVVGDEMELPARAKEEDSEVE
jgi:predicted PurR-regulated permease PerM